MEKLLFDIFNNGLTLDNIFLLLQLVIIFYLIMYIRSKTIEYLAYKTIRSNKRISIGVQIFIPDIEVYAEIIKIDMNHIILKSNYMIHDFPTKKFCNMVKHIRKSSKT